MAEVHVRRLEPGDSLDDLTGMLHRAYEQLADAGMRYVATWQDVDITRDRVSRGECFVALVDEKLAGTIVFEPAATASGCAYFDRPGVALFQQFGVDPAFQGRGIGSRLLDTVEARARETGAEELALDTAIPARHLIALYARRGYRIVDETQWPSTNYRSVIMAKRV